jgi:hypothetical protein
MLSQQVHSALSQQVLCLLHCSACSACVQCECEQPEVAGVAWVAAWRGLGLQGLMMRDACHALLPDQLIPEQLLGSDGIVDWQAFSMGAETTCRCMHRLQRFLHPRPGLRVLEAALTGRHAFLCCCVSENVVTHAAGHTATVSVLNHMHMHAPAACRLQEQTHAPGATLSTAATAQVYRVAQDTRDAGATCMACMSHAAVGEHCNGMHECFMDCAVASSSPQGGHIC